MSEEKEEQQAKHQDTDNKEDKSGSKAKNLKYILVVLIVAVAAAAGFVVSYLMVRSDGETVSNWEAPKEVTLTDGQKAMVRSDESGVPSFLTGNINAPVAATKKEAAIAFFNTNKDLYKMNNPVEELKVTSEIKDNLGMEHVKMAQVYQDVPVFGYEMVVHFSPDGKISRVNGDYKPEVKMSVEAEISQEDAVTKAREDLGVDIAEVSSETPPRLVIFALEGQDAALAWKIRIGSNEPIVQMLYFIDAHDGGIVAKYDEIIE